jgi:CRISPR/Cas system-associated exonuclease Cas4 (RecB family)
VRGAYVHDLKAAAREPVPVDLITVEHAERTVADAADRMRSRDYRPNPGPRCRRCEVRTICASAVR